VAETVQAATEPVTTLTTPVAETVQAATEPVTQTVTTLTTPLSDTLQATTEPVTALTTPLTDTVQAATEPVTDLLGTTTTPIAGPIAEGVDAGAAPIAQTVDSVGPLAPIVPLTGHETAVGSIDPSVVLVPPPDLVPIPGTETTLTPFPDLLTPVAGSNTLKTLPTASLVSNPPFHGGIVDDLLAGTDAAADLLPIAAAVGVATVTVVSIARGVLTPSAAVMFTNVRLLPCVVDAAVERTGVAASDAVSRLGSAAATASRRAEAGIVGAVVEPIREGFDQAVSRPVSKSGEGLRDGRLLAQIGIVLGTIYVAFLTLWFWATRLRWNARA
jgi:hypothetical protein